MSDRQLSLTDVMLGMERLSIHLILTPSCFRFFWALIMKANSLNPRFKNPFDLSASQAVGIGGGESRQAVNQKQNTLKNIKIDGEWLIKIKAGSKINNRPALYEINYDLILPQRLFVPTFAAQPSNSVDDTLDDTLDGDVDGILDDNRSILRSEERRGEEKTTTEAVVDRPSALEEEPIPNIRSDQVVIEGAIIAKYRSQIMEIPPSQTRLRDALELYSVDQLQEAIARMPDILRDGIQDGNGVLGLACKAIRNPHWWTNGELQGEATDEKERLREELRMEQNALKQAEGQREADGDKHGYEEYLNGVRQRIEDLEVQINESV